MADSDWFDGFGDDRLRAGEVRLRVRVGGAASAPPLLLLHGFPQTGAMWHRVARALAPIRRLVIPDLRGYGDSDKPPGGPDHLGYAKRTMAADLHTLMRALGHDRYEVAGHDRGARVAHRLALDQPQAVQRLMLLDIAPTLDMYEATDMRFASAYYHWFFLIQPAPHPERLIAAAPHHFLHWKLGGWGTGRGSFREAAALAEYERAMADPDTVHAMCEDYRASAGIDLEHDRQSRRDGQRLRCPTRVLWGRRGVVHALFDPLALWRAQCDGPLDGRALDCGHYIPEELPDETAAEMAAWFGADGADGAAGP